MKSALETVWSLAMGKGVGVTKTVTAFSKSIILVKLKLHLAVISWRALRVNDSNLLSSH